MVNEILDYLSKQFQLEEIDLGDYKKVDRKLMHFVFHSYEIKGIGRFSTISMKGFFGLMKMESFILTPYHMDMPLLSYDGIRMLNKFILFLEVYKTNLNNINLSSLSEIKNQYSFVKDDEIKNKRFDDVRYECSLKKTFNRKNRVYNDLIVKYTNEYINLLKCAMPCDINQKTKKVDDYVLSLLNNGGSAATQLQKMIGREKTEVLFRECLFGSHSFNK